MTSACDTTTLSVEAQYLLVYEGIRAVASNCDGAVTEDGVGFNGQDTMFGRRIAAVAFEQWTEDVKLEAARIANTYQKQILRYLGVEIQKLAVVREAMGKDTNHQARNDARTYERQAAAASRRQVRLGADGTVACDFPYDARLKDALKAEGARWNGEAKTWDFRPGTLTRAALDLVRSEFVAPDEIFDCLADRVAPAAPAKPTIHGYMISDEVVFNFPYNPGQKDAIKAAGARWNGADKTWRVRTNHPNASGVVAAARQAGLIVAVEVDTALGGAVQAETIKLDRKATLVAASRLSRPGDLPAEFLALVAEAVR